MPGEMFTSAEDHATVAIASALEGLRWRGSVAFVHACTRARTRGEDGGVVGGDEGHAALGWRGRIGACGVGGVDGVLAARGVRACVCDGSVEPRRSSF